MEYDAALFGLTCAQAKAGEAKSLDVVLRVARAELLTWASRNLWNDLRSLEESDDLLQEIQLRVVSSVKLIEDTTFQGFRSWLFRLARNTLADQRRHFTAQRRSAGIGRSVCVPRALDALSCEPSASATTPCLHAQKREHAERMHAAPGKLERGDRALITLRDFEAKEFGEIAAHLTMPSADAARKAYHRAVCRLGRLLTEV